MILLFYIFTFYFYRSDEMEMVMSDLERANEVFSWIFVFVLFFVSLKTVVSLV